jgi:LysR family cys regulon transcriptional activator
MREEPVGSDLVARPLGSLLGSNVTRIAFKRGAYLRNYVYSFAELLSERLSRKLIEKAMNGDATDFGM